MRLFTILVLYSFLFQISLKAQPGYESRPVQLWVFDKIDLSATDCNKKFKITAEFIKESDLNLANRPVFSETLTCAIDSISHLYYDANKKTQHLAAVEAIPMFFHPGRNEKEEYLLHAIHIQKGKQKMSIKTGLYLLKDDLLYSHGNWVDIPTIIFFKAGEFNIKEVQAFPERKVILDKYREKTAGYHQRQEEQIVQEVKAVVPELPNDYISTNTGFAALKLSKSNQLPLHDAKVRAYFNDSISIEMPFYNSDAKSATYLYTADPKGSYAPINIKKIEATAPGYISESIIPQRTISELALLGQNEDFIYNYGFQKFPIHSDLRYILVLLRDRQRQPENWALMLDSLNSNSEFVRNRHTNANALSCLLSII